MTRHAGCMCMCGLMCMCSLGMSQCAGCARHTHVAYIPECVLCTGSLAYTSCKRAGDKHAARPLPFRNLVLPSSVLRP